MPRIAQHRSLLALSAAEAHLWYVFPDALTDSVLLDAYYQLLCPEERDQHKRFRFAKGRHEYLVTRALVRTVLSHYVAVDPRTWQFEKNTYGKPAIAYPHDILPLSFNLSNTNGLVVCLVALDREVGVDVEDMERPGKTVEIADSFFSPAEVAALRALPGEARRDRFFTYWTLKESYIKARGMGLSLPLDRFSFHLAGGCPVRISFDSRLGDEPDSWQFAQFRPTSRHVIAVAIRRGVDSDLTIQLRQTVPLGGRVPPACG
jgi:4'-phosphopantetheinyl transferase